MIWFDLSMDSIEFILALYSVPLSFVCGSTNEYLNSALGLGTKAAIMILET